MKRIVVFGLFLAALWTAENIWLSTWQPEIAARLAISQVNGGGLEAMELRRFEALRGRARLFVEVMTVLAAFWCLAPLTRRAWRRARVALGEQRIARSLIGSGLP